MHTELSPSAADRFGLLRNTWQRFALLSLACFAALSAGRAALAAETPAKRQWAVLIGAGKYQHASRLPFIAKDVEQIADALTKYGYCNRRDILSILDTSTKNAPTKKTIETQLPEWLAKVGKDDHVLVFFSGHGFRDAGGKLYLAPVDCNPKDVAATGIPVQWLRTQVAGCKAKFKLVVLDACHAGTEKGEADSTGITAKELGESFRDLSGVVTLASSTGDEKSQIWFEKQQSLFSYWFVQGIKGNADEKGDGAVSVDELYNYVHRNVTETAQRHFPKSQTPVRIVRSGTSGVPTVIRLRPRDSLKQLLADLAEQLARDLKDRGIKRVGVLEFTTNTRLQEEVLGGDFGPLGQYCGVELQRELIARSGNRYQLINRRTLKAALRKRNFAIDDLGSIDALKGLSVKAKGMPVVAVGTLAARAGRVVTVQCELLGTEDGATVSVASGTAKLIESEWAMLGLSTHVTSDDRRPPRQRPGQAHLTVTDSIVQRLDQRSQQLHPLDPKNKNKFPFRVSLNAGQSRSSLQERKPDFQGNRMYVALEPGEMYEIGIESSDTRPIFMRLLVDGKNTLPERVITKGVSVEAKPEDRQAQVVNLAEARAWHLEPATEKDGKVVPRVYPFRGFFKKTGDEGSINAFRVATAPDTPGSRDEFGGDIGVITAAFYLGIPKGSAKALQTVIGEEYDEKTGIYYGDDVPGPLLGVVHVNYVTPEAIKSLGK